jgi:hypothetical protein
MLQAGSSRVRFPMRSFDFFNLPNPSRRTVTQESTQPLTEISTRNLPGGKGRPARKADSHTSICEPRLSRKYGSLDASEICGPFTFFLSVRIHFRRVCYSRILILNRVLF